MSPRMIAVWALTALAPIAMADLVVRGAAPAAKSEEASMHGEKEVADYEEHVKASLADTRSAVADLRTYVSQLPGFAAAAADATAAAAVHALKTTAKTTTPALEDCAKRARKAVEEALRQAEEASTMNMRRAEKKLNESLSELAQSAATGGQGVQVVLERLVASAMDASDAVKAIRARVVTRVHQAVEDEPRQWRQKSRELRRSATAHARQACREVRSFALALGGKGQGEDLEKASEGYQAQCEHLERQAYDLYEMSENAIDLFVADVAAEMSNITGSLSGKSAKLGSRVQAAVAEAIAVAGGTDPNFVGARSSLSGSSRTRTPTSGLAAFAAFGCFGVIAVLTIGASLGNLQTRTRRPRQPFATPPFVTPPLLG